jgi:hypothetical protein
MIGGSATKNFDLKRKKGFKSIETKEENKKNVEER